MVYSCASRQTSETISRKSRKRTFEQQIDQGSKSRSPSPPNEIVLYQLAQSQTSASTSPATSLESTHYNIDARDRIATGSSKEDAMEIDSSLGDEQTVAFPPHQSQREGGDATVQQRDLLATFGGDNDDQGDEDGFQISALKRANHSLNVDLQHTHMRENDVWHSHLPSTSSLQWRPRPRPRRAIHRNKGVGIFGRLNATDDESTSAGLHRVKEREQNAIAETFYPKESYANQQAKGEDVSMVDIANIAPSISLLIRTLRERCPNAAESHFSSSSSGWCTSDDDDSESEATSHSALLSKQATFLPLKRTTFHK